MDNEINNPKSENSRSIFRNVLYGFSTFVLPLGFSLYATKIIVQTFGNAEYGIYALVLGFVTYSFNFSFGRAVTKYVAEYKLSGQNHKIRDVISAALFINLVFGLAGILILCLSAKWLVVNYFLIDVDNQAKAIHALYITALIVYFLMINQIFSAILQGIHRFDVYSNISNFNNITTVLGNIFLVYNGFSLVHLFVWNLITTGVSGLLLIFYAKRLLPEFGINFKLKPEMLKLVFRFSTGIVGYQILANFLLLFERSWIFRKLGDESLTFYVVPMTISLLIHTFIGSFALVIFPLAAELRNNTEKLLKLYKKATRVVCFFVVFLATTMIIEGNLFLTLWMGKDFAAQTSNILIVHIMSFSLVAIQIVSWQMTEGLGHPHYNTAAFTICLVINVLLMWLLIGSFGNLGVAFGRLAGFSAMFLAVFYVEKIFFGRVQIRFWLNLFVLLGTAAICSVVTEKIIVSNFQETLSVFIFATICGGIVYCAVLLILGFVDSEDKLLIKNLIRR